MTFLSNPQETPAQLVLSAQQWSQMASDVESRLPEEACGLLLGAQDQVVDVVAVTNSLHSPVRYRMDSQEQLQVFLRIEEAGGQLLAIYHSHPAGPSTPSPTDIMEAFYPDSIYVIWSKDTGTWVCRGFRIQDGQFYEISLQIMDGE